jgi:aminoglycoside phosphotransferase (APT) family kinase protein
MSSPFRRFLSSPTDEPRTENSSVAGVSHTPRPDDDERGARSGGSGHQAACSVSRLSSNGVGTLRARPGGAPGPADAGQPSVLSGPFEALARRIDPGSRLVRTWELEGGASAQVSAFEIELADGRTERLIARRHGPRDLKRNPQIAADEFRLLQLVTSAGVPAPAPRYIDRDGEVFSVPCLVVNYVEGERPADEADLGQQLAIVLAQIHRVGSRADISFLRERNLGDLPPPHADESAGERRAREALRSRLPLAEKNRSVLLHGDFWPGNTLWKDGRLVAVIDWEDAATGDPLADVANARLELLWAQGAEAMDAFTHRYESITTVDFTDLPYWDLRAGLRLAGGITEWGLDEATQEALRTGHDAFVAQALERLAAR